ncbi:MAG: DUF2784 domain-containing protein [Thermoguttaceae bacterium]
MPIYRFLADVVVAIHLALVGFIVIGLAAILLGIACNWRWVRNFWFRIVHLAMIATVVEKTILGVKCLLTQWEDRLREMAGETVEEGTFIGRMLHEILFWQVSPDMMRVLRLAYYLFGLAILLVFIFAPPRWPWKQDNYK